MHELWNKIKEALVSALPITAIVYIMALLPWFDVSASELLAFTVSAVLLIVGIGLFNMGADLAMTPIGSHVGAGLSRQKKLGLLLGVAFVMGLLITVAEPDLKVLADQLHTVITPATLIVTVGVGVGAFLLVAILRIVFKRQLSMLLMLFYMLLFALTLVLCIQEKTDLLPAAFDSGGVTTGPITVPFIMALGVGISSVLGDRRSQENSFGLVALCSIGPILAVLLLGVSSGGDFRYEYVSEQVPLWEALGHQAVNIALPLGMIVAFFLICQVTFLHLPKRQLLRIGMGVAFTYLGLVLFLTSVEVGFMPIGYKLGQSIAGLNKWLLIPLGVVIGVLVVLAEPAIHVLNAQVEDVTGGYVTRRSMLTGLCIGVGAAIGLSMVRIVFDFSLVYYIVPGYFISLALSLFVPPVYTAIAFDSGGVASGPMTSGFILPLAVGACMGVQGADAVLRDAFGVVALVAMAPLITIQLLGFRAIVSNHLKEKQAMKRILDADDMQIINF